MESVSLINVQGYSVEKVAKLLGANSSILYKLKQNIEYQQSGKFLTEDKRNELKKLRIDKET